MTRYIKCAFCLFILVLFSHSAFAQIFIPSTFPPAPPTTTPTATTTSTTTTTTTTATATTPTTTSSTIPAITTVPAVSTFPITTPAVTIVNTAPNALKTAPQPAATTTIVTASTSVLSPNAVALASTTAPTTTAIPVTAGIPGYAPNKTYSNGKTAAYIIAPFAIVAGTYFLAGHHQIEIHPNAGFVWPGKVDYTDTTAQLRDSGIYGLKVGSFVNENFEVEANFAYMNHFESEFVPTTLDQSFGVQPRSVYGLLYDINAVYNFGSHPIGPRLAPYVTGGIGGLTTRVRDADAALISGEIYRNDPVFGPVFNPTSAVIVADNSAYFSFNYGAGIKLLNAWGPVGVRGDFRGRTFPNFRGQSMSWPEATAGIVFTFGEK
jgi:hypothetical protein